MHDDIKELRETLQAARQVEGRCLLLDGCMGEVSIERAMRIRALHQMARDVAQEVEALTSERQQELNAAESSPRCAHCEEAPAQWGALCGPCLRDAEAGWPRGRSTRPENVSPNNTAVPWGVTV